MFHIVAIDNDHGHISDVVICSSYPTIEEAEEALAAVHNQREQSHVKQANREEENYQRYLDWASQAIIECPNGYGGLNWTQIPGDMHHEANIKSIPYYVVREFNQETIIEYGHLRIKSTKPLILLQEFTIPPEHWLEYHLAY